MDINIPLVGGTYQARSVPVGSQHTQNFYIEVDPNSNEPALMPFPGLKTWGTTGSGVGRGLHVYRDELYAVTGNNLYKVSVNGTPTSIGVISGTNRVVMDDDGTNLVVAIGSNFPYNYNGTTLTQGSDPDLPHANSCIYINDRFIYDRDGGLAFSDLNDPLVVNSSNILNSNTKSDNTVAVHNRAQQIFSVGTNSIEPINFTGSGTPPYNRVNSAIQEDIGTESPYSLANNKDFIYFLGKDRAVYQMQGFSSRPITNPAIGQAIQNYDVVYDAFGLCFNFDSQFFYLLSFPAEGETWLYNQNVGLWTNLDYYPDGLGSLIAGYAYAYGKHLVSNRLDGNIYELDFDTYQDNSQIIQRIRTTREVKAKDFGLPDRPITMDSLRLRIEPGTSLVTAESQIIMQYSDDNGKTWSQERWADIGDQGEFDYELQWISLGTFRRRIFRFTMSDAIKWVLVSCSAEVEVGLG